MPTGLLLIILGIVIGVLLNYPLGILLVVVGLVLLLVPNLRAATTVGARRRV